ncbi:MAG TPA: NAD-dependent epimerase/dehydratase family protein [Vicinamibacterales bacterium]|nr:NAD-dependent epimerase/dehydratase family protein [Vicinamibacterales bacterium]
MTTTSGRTVFVAGGSGTIGVPLVRALVGAGHKVFATTRSASKQALLWDLGATPVVVDALNAAALERAVRAARPTHVIHQLTALPKTAPKSAADLEPTNRLRDEGTRNLLRAAVAAGARRFIGGSFALIGAGVMPEAPQAGLDRAREAIQSMESQILGAARDGTIEGIVLRYGLFYGPGNPATDDMLDRVRRRRLPRVRGDAGKLPYIHLDDAVSATVAAIDHGASGSVYDIVDDRPASFSEMVDVMAELAHAPRPFTVPAWLPRLVAPYMARLLALQAPLSNAAAKQDLQWTPRFPSYREGLRQTIRLAAA